jgi:spore coat protein U-like protein
MKKTPLIILIILGIISMAGLAMAATATNNIQVLANVPSVCNITTAASNIDFGAYDPTSPTDDTDGLSSVSFRCTKGVTYWTYITGTRQMSGPGADKLNYGLYTDVTRTITWNSVKTGAGTVSGGITPQTIGIYGKIPPGQDVLAGSYSENVVVTIEY